MKQLYEEPVAQHLLMLPTDILTASAGGGGKYDPDGDDEDWGI